MKAGAIEERRKKKERKEKEMKIKGDRRNRSEWVGGRTTIGKRSFIIFPICCPLCSLTPVWSLSTQHTRPIQHLSLSTFLFNMFDPAWLNSTFRFIRLANCRGCANNGESASREFKKKKNNKKKGAKRNRCGREGEILKKKKRNLRWHKYTSSTLLEHLGMRKGGSEVQLVVLTPTLSKLLAEATYHFLSGETKTSASKKQLTIDWVYITAFSCGEQPSSLKKRGPSHGIGPFYFVLIDQRSCWLWFYVFNAQGGREEGSRIDTQTLVEWRWWLILRIDTWRPSTEHLLIPHLKGRKNPVRPRVHLLLSSLHPSSPANITTLQKRPSQKNCFLCSQSLGHVPLR